MEALKLSKEVDIDIYRRKLLLVLPETTLISECIIPPISVSQENAFPPGEFIVSIVQYLTYNQR